MAFEPVSLVSIVSLSALGLGPEEVWAGYSRTPSHALSTMKDGAGGLAYGGRIPETTRSQIREIRESHSAYAHLDPTVIYAIATSRMAVKQAGWDRASRFGVNLGSSRGATEIFERYHGEFLENGKVGSHASPSTTLGNIASWVAQDLGARGPEISHSITCSTALHAVLNGVAWIRAGLEDRFLVGGSEAPLTPFTLAQMRALKIYSRETGEYPSRALDLEKTNNSMVLGEGAGAACLENGLKPGALALISGLGYATEDLTSAVSLSREASCLQRAMNMALAGCDPGEVDAVVMHAPGTLRGDRAEYRALQRVFGQRLPALTTNKWKLGHTLGASGLLSLELAVLMLQHQSFVAVPFVQGIRPPGRFRKILVNAVGFGGNAVSLLVERRPGA